VLPVELQNDVMVIDEPLPSADDLRQIIPGMFESAELAPPDGSVVDQAVDALVGLAAFPAEQALAMSLSKKGLDVERLWERKRQAVEQAPGLTIWRGGETFTDIGGCDNIKRFLIAVLTGQESPRVVVFVDEIEKAFAGTGTDTSGVKTEMTGTMLGWMVEILQRSNVVFHLIDAGQFDPMAFKLDRHTHLPAGIAAPNVRLSAAHAARRTR
jgi:hypothetical protein